MACYFKTPDGKVELSSYEGTVFVWWNYPAIKKIGHIIAIGPKSIGIVLERLQNQLYNGQLHHNGSRRKPMELRVSVDKVSFWTLMNDHRLDGILKRSELLEFLTQVGKNRQNPG